MSNTNEWNLLKHQFDALVHEIVAAESIEQTLDAEFRRRLAEVKTGPRTSTTSQRVGVRRTSPNRERQTSSAPIWVRWRRDLT